MILTNPCIQCFTKNLRKQEEKRCTHSLVGEYRTQGHIDMPEFFPTKVIPKPVTESLVGEYEDLEHVDLLKFYKVDSKRSTNA